MQNTCGSACEKLATEIANIKCRDSKSDDCFKDVGRPIFDECDCKASCQILSYYKCNYDNDHLKKFKNKNDCLEKSKKDCEIKECKSTNKDVLKSMNSTELENEGENEGDAEGENEGDVTNCTCPCCMKGGCNKRGYSSIWYALFVILIVLLFISMFASLVYDGKKRV